MFSDINENNKFSLYCHEDNELILEERRDREVIYAWTPTIFFQDKKCYSEYLAKYNCNISDLFLKIVNGQLQNNQKTDYICFSLLCINDILVLQKKKHNFVFDAWTSSSVTSKCFKNLFKYSNHPPVILFLRIIMKEYDHGQLDIFYEKEQEK